jgi:hypothetical protein
MNSRAKQAERMRIIDTCNDSNTELGQVLICSY